MSERMTIRERADAVATRIGPYTATTYIADYIEQALLAVRKETLEEARNATCSYCADGKWKSATGPNGEPAHLHGGRIVFCKSAAIRAVAEATDKQ